MIPDKYSESWDSFLTEERKQLLFEIEKQIGSDFTPANQNVLRFLKNDLYQMKICIVGQDPYFSTSKDELVANGRSFQPSDLVSWSQKYKQVSLKNMVRLIHKTYYEINNYQDIRKYSEIVKEMEQGDFLMKPPVEWFDSLEKQGVLFLNRYLTTKVGKPNAHRKIWEEFGAELLSYIDEKRPDMVWFLWGNEAILCEERIKKGIVYKSRHPMMCSEKYADDFLKADCFKNTKHLINWLG